jgi:hypothetical protein
MSSVDKHPVFYAKSLSCNKNNSMPSAKKIPSKLTADISAEQEIERLRRDIYQPDMEKFFLFTKMLRTNALYKRAKITHK